MFLARMAAFATAALCVAGPAAAASLTITSISGIWSSSTPTVSGIGSEDISWGVPAETRKSGYSFDHAATPVTVESDSDFVIGTFTHNNFPIRGSFLQSANLRVTLEIAGLANPIVSVFSFLHDETPNSPARCRNGEANAQGVNANGCADLVTATLNQGRSEVFSIDGVNYVLDIMGFQYLGQKLTDFWTTENQSNAAQLLAVFSTEVEQPGPGPDPETPSEVPLPASALLLLAGLGALPLLRRKG